MRGIETKTKWDYTELAESYTKRPGYAPDSIEKMLEIAGLRGQGVSVCDVGAGTGILTCVFAGKGMRVVAIEPNAEMRRYGLAATLSFPNVVWCEGTGERTGQASAAFDFVSFGSSFNVVDPSTALRESIRILKPDGWFACLWNHRDLADPLQSSLERVIHSHLENYDYGARRMDQTAVIESSGLFEAVRKIEGKISHAQTIADCLEAWRSHATLRRQAGNKFEIILREISKILSVEKKTTIQIPYLTRIWLARVKNHARN